MLNRSIRKDNFREDYRIINRSMIANRWWLKIQGVCVQIFGSILCDNVLKFCIKVAFKFCSLEN